MSVSLAALRQSLEVLLEQAGGPVADVIRRAQAQLETLQAELARGDESARLAALYEVSHAIGSSLDLTEALNQVMDAAIRLTGAERGFLMLFNADTGDLDFRAARNIQQETLARADFEVSRSVVREVAQRGQPVVSTNAQTDPRFSGQDSVVSFALRSIMCVPLRVRGRITGVIYVDNKAKAGLFSEGDLDLLEAFANQAAVAIENARLYTLTDQALAARVEELQTMQQIDRELNAALDFDRVMHLTLDYAVRGTAAEAGWIGLMDREKNHVRVAAALGSGIPPGQTLSPDDASIKPVLEAGAPQRLAAGDGRAGHRLAAPVVREGQSIGVIQVARSGAAFDERAQEFLARLADHAAIAIENARLYLAVRQANEAKSQFVSVVSHELKVPMTSIKGYADLLRQGAVGPINDRQREFLNKIRNNVERMSVLVSDLSDISRIETGRLRLEVGDVSVAQAVEAALDGLKADIAAKGQTLAVEAPGDLPPVRCDPQRLVQVLTNLISNAHKYTPSGGKIGVQARAEGRFVRIAVSDTGVGIAPEDQPKLFTQFFRSEDPTVRDQPGWGLGLSIAKRLIELQGGQISAASAPGKGSVFTFTVPVA